MAGCPRLALAPGMRFSTSTSTYGSVWRWAASLRLNKFCTPDPVHGRARLFAVSQKNTSGTGRDGQNDSRMRYFDNASTDSSRQARLSACAVDIPIPFCTMGETPQARLSPSPMEKLSPIIVFAIDVVPHVESLRQRHLKTSPPFYGGKRQCSLPWPRRCRKLPAGGSEQTGREGGSRSQASALSAPREAEQQGIDLIPSSRLYGSKWREIHGIKTAGLSFSMPAN
jgi:hypothetical protein